MRALVFLVEDVEFGAKEGFGVKLPSLELFRSKLGRLPSRTPSLCML